MSRVHLITPTLIPHDAVANDVLGMMRWLRAQNPTDLFAYKKYLSYAADRDAAPPLGEVPVVGELRNQQLLDLLGVRYLVCPAGQPLSPDER